MKRPGLIRAVMSLIALGLVSTCLFGSRGGGAYAAPPAVTVGPGQGVVFEQVDFLFWAVTLVDSDWGRVSADPDDLFASTGISSGFLNAYTDAGWVVQNLIVDVGDGPDATTTYFNLDVVPPSDVTSLSAHVEFTSSPQLTFGDGPRSSFAVGASGWNAEGAGGGFTTTVGDPPPGNLMYPGGADWEYMKPAGAANEQTADSQCFPMSICNSLQYLGKQFTAGAGHPHTKGLKNDGTCVGELDKRADRKNRAGTGEPTRTDGSGVWFPPMLRAKFSYLDDHGLKDALVHRHQGRGYGNPPDQALPAGDFQGSGITSKDDGGKVTWEWICDQVKKCEDVELVWSYDDASGNPTGGHAVRVIGCGMTDGRKWIKYLHDAQQTPQNDPGDNKGLETPEEDVADLDGDTILNVGSPDREIRFALSESKPKVGGTTELLVGGSDASANAAEGSGSSEPLYVALAGGLAAAAAAVAAGGWYVRRRWLR